jgi:hypothetical protein
MWLHAFMAAEGCRRTPAILRQSDTQIARATGGLWRQFRLGNSPKHLNFLAQKVTQIPQIVEIKL